MKLKIVVIVMLLLAAYLPAFSQACGYTYAKFYVEDSSGKVIRDVEFQFLKQDSNEVAFVPKSLRWVETDSHYFLAKGMWGGYRDVTIRVTAKGFENAERTFDLPLTNAKNPLNFQIRLNRVGIKGKSSFDVLEAKQTN
jgi:hypothetical protein